MTNLQTFDNLYASLSQSAYEDRPYNFMNELNEIDTFVELNYSETRNDKGDTIFGGQNLPNNGVLYVHKDTTVKKFTDINGSGQVYQYEVGLLKDELEGFNAYFLTDTLQLNADTENAYLSVKGSDGQGLNSLHT